MINRYRSRNVITNDNDMYSEVFNERNMKIVRQYESPNDYRPPPADYKKVQTVRHVWTVGDRYYKLAYQYYGDVKDWWIIAKFNNKPTEAHIKLGEVILIPTRIEEVINLFRL